MFIVDDKQAKLQPLLDWDISLMKGFRSSRFVFLLPLILLSVLLVSGCGKKGPLYLPQKDGQEQRVPPSVPGPQP
jgi:predicted small lipoprotein YifL